jgi:hypothetical protein
MKKRFGICYANLAASDEIITRKLTLIKKEIAQ